MFRWTNGRSEIFFSFNLGWVALLNRGLFIQEQLSGVFLGCNFTDTDIILKADKPKIGNKTVKNAFKLSALSIPSPSGDWRLARQDIWLHEWMFIRAASRGPRRGREGRLNIFGAWIVQKGGRSWSTPPAGDHPAGLWHLAGAEPRWVQLAQEPPSNPTTVARGNSVLPPAGCLCLLIIHTRAPRMPCVITSYAWAQPKGTELHLLKERRKKNS